MSAVEDKLAALGLALPAVVPPLAAYQPAVQSGVYVYTSGQLPMVDGKLPVTGKVGAEVTAEEAKELARTCALTALAAVKSVAGDLDRVARVVKVVGFVASAADFTGQPGVINGASGDFSTVPPFSRCTACRRSCLATVRSCGAQVSICSASAFKVTGDCDRFT